MAAFSRRFREISPSKSKLSTAEATDQWTNLLKTMRTQKSVTDIWTKKTTRTLRSTRTRYGNNLKNLVFGTDNTFPNLKDEEGDIDDIWQAAIVGNVEESKRLLDSDPSLLNSRDIIGATPLHYAVRYNHKDIVQELLSRKVDVNRKVPEYKVTALHLAARRNFTNIMRRLINNDCDINARDQNGMVPLHLSTQQGHSEATKLFLYVGADVNVRDSDQMTPLHYAAQRGDVMMCQLLLSYGADLLSTEINDITPVMFAAICGSLETMTSLMEAGKHFNLNYDSCMNHSDDEGSTVLHLAVARSHLKIASYCLELGADINAQKLNGYTALHIVAISGNVEISTMLIKRGADVNMADHEKMTPLHRAAVYGKMDVIEVLLENGGQLEARDVERFTPLLAAAWKGQTDAAKYLIDKGANIKAKDKELKNCLHWAAEGNHTDFAGMLLENRGNVLMNEKDKNEQTPTHVAVKAGNIRFLQLLIKNNAKICRKDQNERTPLHLASKKGRLDCVEALAEASSTRINEDDVDGKTPLILGSEGGHVKVVKHLLKVGADIDSRDNNRRTALALAALNGHVDVIEVLLKNHSDIDATDKNRNTPLHLSAANGHEEATSFLLKQSANPLLENLKGENCLDIATENQEDVTATVIINNKRWQDIISHTDKAGYTTFNRLIEKLPNVAHTVLDKCVRHSHSDRSDHNLMITYNFKHVDPGPDSVTAKIIGKHWTALKTMIEWKRQDLLMHDICQTLLSLKWKRFGRLMFNVDIVVYLVYLISITAVCLVPEHLLKSTLDNYGCPTVDGTNTSLYYSSDGKPVLDRNYQLDAWFGIEMFIVVYIIINILREFVEVLQSGYRYLMEISNWVDWGLYISALYFIFPPGHRPCVPQWASGAVALFLSWLNFILYLRRINMFGLYVVMFFKVLKSFLKVGTMYMFLAIAFAFAFYILLEQVEYFQSFGDSLVQVIVMSIGELDYTAVFYAVNRNFDVYLASIVFIIFIVLMPILTMNLMLGIAVGDIDAVQKTATIEKLEMEINLLDHMERSLPKFIQRKLYTPKMIVEPYHDAGCCTKMKDQLSNKRRMAEEIERQEKVVNDTESLLDSIEEFKSRVYKRQRLMTQMLELHSGLLQKMAETMEIKFDESEFRNVKDLAN
ncbi:transient receptor potential cation channel subfamily A member 1-like [Glandiceps talaboti]